MGRSHANIKIGYPKIKTLAVYKGHMKYWDNTKKLIFETN